MKPLEGFRVLSVEVYGAGPYGSQLLAALGAEVIKIENPATGGDPARYVGPHTLGAADSQYFQGWNAGKRSVALDLKSDAGRRDFAELVRTSAAVMNNLRGDQPAKLGLDYASLGKINAGVVCLHISAYGRDNERAAWPGYDFLMQAEAGLMSLTGEPDGPPARFGPSIIDYMTGSTAMVGLLACMLAAQRSGTRLRRGRIALRRRVAPAGLRGHLVSEQRRSARRGSSAAATSRSRPCKRSRQRTAGSS